MKSPTYQQIAENFNLWAEYADPDAAYTEDEFHAMSIDKKIALQVEAFGPEANVDDDANA